MRPEIVLPPDVFDALELSALAYGGIGAGSYSRLDAKGFTIPCCVFGHATRMDPPDGRSGGVWGGLSSAGLSPFDNDSAFTERDYLISFPEWCRRLNVVRGEEPTFDPANFPEPSRIPDRAAKKNAKRGKK